VSGSIGSKVLSRKSIVAQVEKLQRVVAEWRENPPMISWRGLDHPSLSQEVRAYAIALFNLVDTMDVEPSARALVLAIDRFDRALQAWEEQVGDVDPSGTQEFWNMYEEMLQAIKPRHFPRPEPLPALVSQKVSYRNMAKIYGWFDVMGNPDVTKVQEELAAPGTHYKKETWKSRSQMRYEDEIEQAWATRPEFLDPRSARRQAETPHKAPPRKCPETIEELLRAGVNAPQIAKMHRVPIEEVQTAASELGIPLSGNLFANAFLSPDPRKDEEEEIRQRADDMRIAGIDTHPELPDRDDKIAAMYAEGVPSQDIAKALQHAFPTLTRQQVTAIASRKKNAVPA
jgi:hypothetical protein